MSPCGTWEARHGRDARVAMRQLEGSLRRLRTDYLDLWQVHECVYYNDPERHFARGGVVEALEKAKRQGKVLRQNLKVARAFWPMSSRERRAFERSLSETSGDGRFELYKTTAEHEGEVGRAQHQFPSQEDVAL